MNSLTGWYAVGSSPSRIFGFSTQFLCDLIFNKIRQLHYMIFDSFTRGCIAA
ncbi:hypothetical protein RU99_GL002154 [Enterococcus casseliflavus]|nr:hypothetical protein RU99_GL002154 [Enterococcus casseliflavus]